jgi:hypothetical protein
MPSALLTATLPWAAFLAVACVLASLGCVVWLMAARHRATRQRGHNHGGRKSSAT